MRQFNNAKITLFDSANAQFKLNIEGTFTRKTQTGVYQPLAYVTDQGNCIINPSIYLVFIYKKGGEERDPALYMSYPQLYKLRSIFREIETLINTDGFIQDNGEVVVNPNHEEPIIYANIGKKNKWMSFKLVTMNYTEEGVSAIIPAISLEMSDNNGGASILTIDEFFTLYSIIHDVNLVDIQVSLGTKFIESYQYGAQQANSYPNQNFQRGFQPQSGYYEQPIRPYNPQFTSQVTAAYSQPQFQGQQNYNKPAQYQPRQQAQSQRYVAPGLSQQAQKGIPPRETANNAILTPEAVQNTPIAEDVFDDDMSAINAIFNDEE